MSTVDAFVRLRGLPNNASEQDIVSFMLPLRCHTDEVTIIRDRHGYATGEAFVRFNSGAEALGRNGQRLGAYCIEVLPCWCSDYDAYVSRVNNREKKKALRYTVYHSLKALKDRNTREIAHLAQRSAIEQQHWEQMRMLEREVDLSLRRVRDLTGNIDELQRLQTTLTNELQQLEGITDAFVWKVSMQHERNRRLREAIQALENDTAMLEERHRQLERRHASITRREQAEQDLKRALFQRIQELARLKLDALKRKERLQRRIDALPDPGSGAAILFHQTDPQSAQRLRVGVDMRACKPISDFWSASQINRPGFFCASTEEITNDPSKAQHRGWMFKLAVRLGRVRELQTLRGYGTLASNDEFDSVVIQTDSGLEFAVTKSEQVTIINDYPYPQGIR
ncbi:unnamed protein product [Vitrella brassicaformis CCMP3155]|uniref:RRM domain-containing protein n=1 Tax=Vitrella brassicaformis (strain CCMP3155) TaxID=1169540 RepID=A0A0G4EX08_VITBC|nr:unnamed protein product [Vitrella brassicaformis CCMP3155]|eukprot:CEM02619.1 unnamed protein product [Vitrella brassicaformis CCMP3155]